MTPAASLTRKTWSAEHLAGVLATTTVRPVVLIECAPINAFAAFALGLLAALVVYLSGVKSKIVALGADCDGWSFCQNHLLISTVRQTESIKPAGNLPIISALKSAVLTHRIQ